MSPDAVKWWFRNYCGSCVTAALLGCESTERSVRRWGCVEFRQHQDVRLSHVYFPRWLSLLHLPLESELSRLSPTFSSMTRMFHDPHHEVSNQLQRRRGAAGLAKVDNGDARAARWIVGWWAYVVKLGHASTFVKRHLDHSRAEPDEAAERFTRLAAFQKWCQERPPNTRPRPSRRKPT